MQRRTFLTSATGFVCIGSLASLPEKLFADLRCTAPNAAGIQQCQSGIESSVANIFAHDSQHASQWCWAASISMVFAYYGHQVPQEKIVRETWGGITNLPGQPGQILADLNRRWTDENNESFSVSGDVYDANPMTAAQDLASNMPLIIGTLGHAMVLTSLVYVRDAFGSGNVQQAVVRDPWPGRGRRVLTPQEWYSTNFLARIRVESAGSNTTSRSERSSGARDTNASGDFCETVKSLLDAARSGFRSIKGPIDPYGSGEAWASKLTLPGAEESTVWIYKDRSLGSECSCRMGRSSDKSAMTQRYSEMVSKMKECLPTTWTFEEPTSRSRRVLRTTKARQGQSRTLVSITLQTIRDMYEVFVTFELEAPD